MPKTKISEFSATPGNNTDIDGINIAEGCAPSGINDAIRELMSQLKDFQAGTAGDSFNGPVGTTTAAAGAFTTLTTSSTVTHNGGTANGVAYLNGSKVLTTGSALTFDGSALSASGNITSGGVLQALTTVQSSSGADLSLNANGLNRDIIYKVNATELMRLVGSSGNLGIGTSSPATQFVVSNAGAQGVEITGSNGAIQVYNRSTSAYGTMNLYANTLYFRTGASPAINMTLDSSGNLGIGTTSPFAGSITVARGAGVQASVEIAGNNTTAGSTSLSLIQATDSTTYIYNRANTAMVFGTNNTERARITSGGDFLVGTTNTSASTGSGLKFIKDVNGANSSQVAIVTAASGSTTSSLSIYSTGAAAYRFYVVDSGTIYATSNTITSISDQRLKENIQDIDVGLNAVMALKPRKFDWKAGKGKDKKGDRGWIAQEFEQVFPDMVQEWLDPAPEGEEPYKAVNADLIPVLVKAMQEQQVMINELKAEVAALKAK